MIRWLKDLLQSNLVAEAPAGGRIPPPPPPPTVRALPGETLAKQLALVIDLNVCVGCHACVTSCKQWNTSGSAGPLADLNAYGANPTGTFFNRVQTYEAGTFPGTDTIHFPKSCLHCEDPPCVPVCPTGASYKRKEDGIVLVDYDKCIGCKYCAWACPYGAREMDAEAGVMKKCTLCVDRIYNDNLPEEDREPACVRTCPTGARHFGDLGDPDSDVSRLVAARDGFALMPELRTKPVNRYLPPRKKDAREEASLLAPLLDLEARGFAGWLDRMLGKME